MGELHTRHAFVKLDGYDEKISCNIDILEDTGQVTINKDSGGQIITHISKCIIEL